MQIFLHKKMANIDIYIYINLYYYAQDFCGVLSEEAIRKNFVLIYELLDEIFDFGHPQYLSSEYVKPHIVNEPVPIVTDNALNINMPKTSIGKFSIFTPSTISSVAVQRSIKDEKSKKNEIFVDVFEKISVLFNSSGYVINSSIEGCIQMKYYDFLVHFTLFKEIF